MEQKTPQPTNHPLVSKQCSQCHGTIDGIEHEGFLWPEWMNKADSAKFPPHGPRIYNLSDGWCWTCAAKGGKSWHK